MSPAMVAAQPQPKTVASPAVCAGCDGEGWVGQSRPDPTRAARRPARRWPCPVCRCVCGAEPVDGLKTRLCARCDNEVFLDADDQARRREDR